MEELEKSEEEIALEKRINELEKQINDLKTEEK